MSNRIDLTQFENITAGEWSIIRNGNRIDIGVGTSSAYSPIITFTTELAEMVMKIERDVADMNAIASVPNLIAELKRCYEELDCKNKWLEELDRCPTCGQEGLWATADADAEFDDECRRCGRDKNASQ